MATVGTGGPARAERRHGVRWVVISLLVIVVLGAGAAIWVGVGSGHGTADPGGRVLARMESIRQAVPAGATDVTDEARPAAWGPACPEIQGSHAGWIQAYASVSFTDTNPAALVVSSISGVLGATGWRRHDEATGPHRGRIAHWTLTLPAEPPVTTFAFQVPAHSGHWAISTAWQPAGPVDEGCP
jgi:hypothetical protein